VRTLGTPFVRAVPLLLARDGAREPPGLRRRSLLLVSAAFALPLAYVIWLNGLWVAGGGNVYPGFAGAALNFTYVANVALTLATAGFAAHQALRSPDEELRRWFRGMTAALVLVVVSVAIVALAAPEDLRRAPPPFFAGLVAFVFGLWLLVRDQALVYALLRTQLFDIDVKVRWTIKQSTVAGVFIGVFFIVSEAAQQVLSTTVGPVIGIVAAGALLFALAPLQHAAERVASAAVPGAKAAGDMTTDERRRAYLDAARLAWADGSISKDERAMLEQFRASLGIAEQEAYRIEREAAKGGA
ncbi:MAG TPA: hypothetical protein VGR28_02355, partial [Candidatus Thermoplasmatota archaeon]|nr:hypothetical protein [Candidatus Thermoplasmatota archaeon]